MADFSIPAEYQDQLEVVPAVDQRTNEEILQSLTQYAPVTSEKNIWAFWDKGVTKMPAWNQRNVVDWIRICGPSWTVRIVDNQPDSPNYALRYVSAELLPEAFVNRTMVGPYIGPHSADFLRGALLYEHGGAFMDVGNILFRHMDRLCWNQLEDPASPYQIAVPLMYAQNIANHFVAARKGDPFIKRWYVSPSGGLVSPDMSSLANTHEFRHELFIHLWKGHTSHEGLLSNPLIVFGKDHNFDESRASNFHWDFAVGPQTVMEYIAQVLAWARLCKLEEAGDGFSCADYWLNNIMCFDVLQEDWPAEAEIGFNAAKIFELLSMRRDGDKESEDYKLAEKMVWRLLASSSMQKVTHGKGLVKTLALGALLDSPENVGKDCAPGTFFELLRYGSVHFRQKRESIVLMEAKRPSTTMKKGVLEP